MTNEAIAALLSSSPSARLDDSHPQYAVIRVANEHAEGAVTLHGAQVIDYRPNDAQALLYLSPAAVYREGTPIRGGVPICWPWFGPHPSDPAKPSHGFARNRFWSLDGIRDEPDGSTVLSFSLPPERVGRELWSHPFELTLSISIGPALNLSLSTLNRGSEAFAIGGALHSYFAVSDVRSVAIEGLEACSYQDALLEGLENRQEGPLRVDREIDRIYRDPAPVISLVDPGWKRRVHVEGFGSRSTVVWNPGGERSAALRDLPDDGYRHFVCIETANAGENRPVIEPGAHHSLGCRISTTGLTEAAGDGVGPLR